MNEIEFGKICQPLNKKYFELFGYIPVFYDYAASREDYILLLKKAVNEKTEIDRFVKKIIPSQSDHDEDDG